LRYTNNPTGTKHRAAQPSIAAFSIPELTSPPMKNGRTREIEPKQKSGHGIQPPVDSPGRALDVSFATIRRV
jgi:hypothetical protein